MLQYVTVPTHMHSQRPEAYRDNSMPISFEVEETQYIPSFPPQYAFPTAML